MTDHKKIRILLVEDDEDDYRIIKDAFSEIYHVDFSLDWVSHIEDIPEKTQNKKYDICLMDYRLGKITGVDLMKKMIEMGFDAPFIILTGYGDHDIDVLAMKSGAADYLEKDKIYPDLLERAIRYALEHKRHTDALQTSARRLRILSAKLVNAQEDEKKRVAREIHDGLGSSLVAIKYGLESILTRMREKKPCREGASMEQVIDYVKDTIEEARRISSNLRPPVLDDMGLDAAVRWICRRSRDIYPDIRIQKRFDPEEIDVDPYLKVIVFRVLQEAMNNITKHSGADTVHLDLVKSGERLTLAIKDNGQGFDTREASESLAEGGIGLIGMRERVDLSGGSLDITSAPGWGCMIHAVWPLSGFDIE
jgi:signal transduction histidine kinase